METISDLILRTLSGQACRQLINSRQLFETLVDARRLLSEFAGGMTWHTTKGRQYLIRVLDSRGSQTSLGPHSPETVAIHARFVEGKAKAKDRLASLELRVDEQARLSKALRISRVPVSVARILRELGTQGLLGAGAVLIGAEASFA